MQDLSPHFTNQWKKITLKKEAKLGVDCVFCFSELRPYGV